MVRLTSTAAETAASSSSTSPARTMSPRRSACSREASERETRKDLSDVVSGEGHPRRPIPPRFFRARSRSAFRPQARARAVQRSRLRPRFHAPHITHLGLEASADGSAYGAHTNATRACAELPARPALRTRKSNHRAGGDRADGSHALCFLCRAAPSRVVACPRNVAGFACCTLSRRARSYDRGVYRDEPSYAIQRNETSN